MASADATARGQEHHARKHQKKRDCTYFLTLDPAERLTFVSGIGDGARATLGRIRDVEFNGLEKKGAAEFADRALLRDHTVALTEEETESALTRACSQPENSRRLTAEVLLEVWRK